MKRALLAISLPAVLLGACADDVSGPSQTSVDATDDGDATGADDEGGESESEGGESESEADTATEQDSDDGEPLPPPPSTGIQIVDVTIDQGVRVPIVQHGNYLTPSQRSVDVLRDRPAALRAFYLLEEGFEPRTIYAVLTVQLGGETLEVEALQTAFPEPDCEGQVQMDCRYGSSVGSFNFRVPEQFMQPGVEFKIETFEASPGYEDEPTAAIPHYPWEGGMQQIGVEDTYLKMRVVMVPVYHDVGNQCEPAPDLSEPYGMDYDGNELTVAEYMALQLKAANPVDEVEIIERASVSWSGSLTNGSLLGALADLRAQDNAPPEQYYYAVAVPCQGYPDFSGIAYLGGPSKNASSSRVGWGVWYANKGQVAETFVHEVGHQQGREHIHCAGTEANTDPSYPNNDGDTDSFGTHVFRNPMDTHGLDDHDYMTYCESTWVSEWGWNLVYPWIDTISGWELEGASGEGKRPLLFGHVGGDAEPRWWIANDYWDPSLASGLERVELEVAGDVVAVEGARHVATDHTGEYLIVAPLPEDHHGGALHWTDREGVRRPVPELGAGADLSGLGQPSLLAPSSP